jgi:translation initiation factor IF-2
MIQKRPPIVVILGHIDHGKSTLLDTIQKTNIVANEFGGITQKINAYEINYQNHKITFIDTPGHSAFFKLREKGAQIADLAILIIAADEGIKPQTIECLDYIKKFNLPFIVAFNKIDKPHVNLDKVKQQLADLDVLVEDWGGQIPSVNISALKNIGINELLDLILLLADILDLKYDDQLTGEGYVLEITKDNRKGILVGAIITNGKIKTGDYLTTATASGKIKFLENHFGQKIDSAYPSMPVIINGFENPPQPGEIFKVVDKEILNKVKIELQEKEINFRRKIILVSEDYKLEINLIIKTDVFGSLEALEYLLNNLAKSYHIKFNLIKGDLGLLTSEDLKLAKQTNSIIIAFNIKLPKTIYEEIKNLNILLIESNIIYEIEDKIKDIIEIKKEEKTHKGELQVLGVFNKTTSKKTIGGQVIYGKLKLNDKVLIIREGTIIGKGKIISLEKNKNPVNEVFEKDLCGLIINTNVDININDYLLV